MPPRRVLVATLPIVLLLSSPASACHDNPGSGVGVVQTPSGPAAALQGTYHGMDAGYAPLRGSANVRRIAA